MGKWKFVFVCYINVLTKHDGMKITNSNFCGCCRACNRSVEYFTIRNNISDSAEHFLQNKYIYSLDTRSGPVSSCLNKGREGIEIFGGHHLCTGPRQHHSHIFIFIYAYNCHVFRVRILKFTKNWSKFPV